MKPLNWVELTRQQIKARHGFGWSIQGIEKQNKVITKIVYRFSNGCYVFPKFFPIWSNKVIFLSTFKYMWSNII